MFNKYKQFEEQWLELGNGFFWTVNKDRRKAACGTETIGVKYKDIKWSIIVMEQKILDNMLWDSLFIYFYNVKQCNNSNSVDILSWIFCHSEIPNCIVTFIGSF